MGKRSRRKRGGGIPREVMIEWAIKMHFPDVEREEDYCCARCEDFRIGVCPGENRKGPEVAECMLHAEFGFI